MAHSSFMADQIRSRFTVSGAARLQEAVPSPAHFYRPELDVLRFFAFLVVFLFHTLNSSGSGFLMRFGLLSTLVTQNRLSLRFGLCLFFFLSSYLITSLLVIERKRTGSIHLPRFYLRRMLRIWPLYLFFLCATFLVGHHWNTATMEPGRFASFLLLVGNFYCIRFGLGTPVSSPLWSISVEEQFYLVWPLLGRVLSKRVWLALCCALCAASLAGTWAFAAHGATQLTLWWNTLVQSIFFASGAITALLVGQKQYKPSIFRAAGCVGAGLLAWALGQLSLGSKFQTEVLPARTALSYALVAIGCALIFHGFLHLPQILLCRPLIYLGRISYGLYVFHLLIVALTLEVIMPRLPHVPGEVVLIALPATILVATLSYEVLERPILRLKHRFEFIDTRPDSAYLVTETAFAPPNTMDEDRKRANVG